MTPILLRDRTIRRAIAALGCLAAFNAWAFAQFNTSKDAAYRSKANSSEVAQLVQQIRALRQIGAVAAPKIASSDDLVRHLESAAQRSGIVAERLTRVAPGAPRRVQESPFIEQPVELALNQVSLPQLLNFLRTVTDTQEGLRISSLRLSAPREPSEQELWRADVTVTYLVYSPSKSGTSGRRA